MRSMRMVGRRARFSIGCDQSANCVGMWRWPAREAPHVALTTMHLLVSYADVNKTPRGNEAIGRMQPRYPCAMGTKGSAGASKKFCINIGSASRAHAEPRPRSLSIIDVLSRENFPLTTFGW